LRTRGTPSITQRHSRAVREFVDVELAGGAVLVAATVCALVWANSPWDGAYRRLWSTEAAVALGSHHLELDLREWVNDALMAVFFLVVGLEIKRELVEGELREPRRASCPPSPPSTPEEPECGAGASPWPPTSPSPSACSPSSDAASRRR
jgi:hypothetical protein